MHRQARLPEFFDQITQNTPVLEFGSEPPLPQLKFRQILALWVLTLQNTPLSPVSGGWSMWRLIAVFPKDTISFNMVEEEQGILTFCNDWMCSLPHFQFKSINITPILTSELKTCVYSWRLVSLLLLRICIS